MATTRIIGGWGSTESQIFYDKTLISRALPKLVHDQYGRKSPIPAGSGITINWRKFEAIADSETALTEGTPGAAVNPSVSSVTATIAQYGQFAYVSDLLEDQAIDRVTTELTANFGEAMGKSRDIIVRDVLVAGSTLQYASTSGSLGGVGSGMLLNTAEIREAVATLRVNNADPIEDELFIGIIHPNTQRDLLADSTLLTAWNGAYPRSESNNFAKGTIGDVLGVRFVVTSNAAKGASLGMSGADVYYALSMGKGYYAVTELSAEQARTYIKPKGSAGTEDPIDQKSSIGYKFAMAAARLDENACVRIDHVCTSKMAA